MSVIARGGAGRSWGWSWGGPSGVCRSAGGPFASGVPSGTCGQFNSVLLFDSLQVKYTRDHPLCYALLGRGVSGSVEMILLLEKA